MVPDSALPARITSIAPVQEVCRRVYSNLIHSSTKTLLLLPAKLILFAFVGVCTAQENAIRIDIDLVRLPVNVVDRDGRFIIGLNQKNFTVFENGVEQEIVFYNSVDAPITLMLLLDRSGSMVPHYQQLADAANAFVRQLRSDDTILVATFADETDLVAGPIAVSELDKGIEIRGHRDDMSTMLFDGVDYGLKKIKKVSGRKIIVLFSDGVGAGKFASEKKNFHDAEESDSLVYTIRFPPQFYRGPGRAGAERIEKVNEDSRRYMDELAKRSGGRSFQIDSIADLSTTFTQIALEISGQYTLGYYPSNPVKNGERRKIRVTADVPNAAVRSRSEVVFLKKK